MRRDFEGDVYWDKLADRCGNISSKYGIDRDRERERERLDRDRETREYKNSPTYHNIFLFSISILLHLSLIQRCGLNESAMNLALETYNNDGKHLTNPNILLKNEGFFRRHTVCSPPHLHVHIMDN